MSGPATTIKAGCAGICGKKSTATAARPDTPPRPTVSRTPRSGRRPITTHGTAVSQTAIRTSTPPTMRQLPAAPFIPPSNIHSCPATSVLGLSNDWTALNASIDTMAPAGNTNQAIGLQLGWQTLTAAPYTVPADRLRLQVPDRHHPADRRSQHARSLVFERVVDRRAPTENLRQHQGRGPDPLHGPGQHRRRCNVHVVAELRQRLEQVLPADHGGTDCNDLRPDRYFALQASLGDVVIAAAELGLLKRDTPPPRRNFFASVFPPSNQPCVNDGSEECRAFAQSLTTGVYHSSH